MSARAVRRPASSYTYNPLPSEDTSVAGSEEGVWEKYKLWILGGAAIAITVGVYFWMKSRQEESERKGMRERQETRLNAERYADEKGKYLAQQMLRKALGKRGVRHDLGDPGIQSGLGSTHDFETNIVQKASPEGMAVTTEINQMAAPAHSRPNEMEPVYGVGDGGEEEEEEEEEDEYQ